jgi:hypothetical protein
MKKFVHLHPSNERKVNMRVTTSDGKGVGDFERLQRVVEKTRTISAIKRVAKTEKDGEITYNGHSIRTGDQPTLVAQIPNVLDDMRLYSWNGEIYEEGKAIFQSKFAKCLNLLLTWLGNIHADGDAAAQVGITAFEMQSVIEWIRVITKECESKYSEDDVVCIENMISQL